METGSGVAIPAIDEKAHELEQFLGRMKEEMEVFLGKPTPECRAELSAHPPIINPLTEIMNSLDTARGLAGDIRGIIFGEVFNRIRQ